MCSTFIRWVFLAVSLHSAFLFSLCSAFSPAKSCYMCCSEHTENPNFSSSSYMYVGEHGIEEEEGDQRRCSAYLTHVSRKKKWKKCEQTRDVHIHSVNGSTATTLNERMKIPQLQKKITTRWIQHNKTQKINFQLLALMCWARALLMYFHYFIILLGARKKAKEKKNLIASPLLLIIIPHA